MTTPEPVTDTTEDPRVDALARAYLCLRKTARDILTVADAADAAAGIRRVTLDEAIERAAKAVYEQYPHARWDDATERQRRGPRDEVRPMVTAAFGGAS